MNKKSEEKLAKMLDLMDSAFESTGKYLSVQMLADKLSMAKSTAHAYLQELQSRGEVFYEQEVNSYITKKMDKVSRNNCQVPKLGTISCGAPSENYEDLVDETFTLPRELLGKGQFYMVTAKGQSMIGAGIEEGDLVIIKETKEAHSGQIVVARIDDNPEYTLKTLIEDGDKCYLHPENKTMKDMYFKKIEICGVAIKIIKDL